MDVETGEMAHAEIAHGMGGEEDRGEEWDETAHRLDDYTLRWIITFGLGVFRVGGFSCVGCWRFADLLKILLDELLIHQRDFVAVNFAASFDVSGLFLGPRRLELLAGGTDFDHDFAGNGRRALADDLTDLAHGLLLLGFLGGFITVGGSDSAFVPGGVFFILRFVPGFRVLLVGLLALTLLLSLGVGILRVVLAAFLILRALLIAFFLAAGLRILAVLRRLLAFLGGATLHFIEHVRHGVLQLVEHGGFFVGLSFVVQLALFLFRVLGLVSGLAVVLIAVVAILRFIALFTLLSAFGS